MAAPMRYTKETMAAFVKNGDWEFRTWSAVWDRNARDFPHKEALVGSGKRLTWAEAKEKIDRLALGFLEMVLGSCPFSVLPLRLATGSRTKARSGNWRSLAWSLG